MYTAVFIRRHINRLPDKQLFSIREFLTYGSRNAVDQVFFRLVKAGQIIRIARGLFIKCPCYQPSLLEIARAKALAFGKKIITHGSQAALTLGIKGSMDSDSEASFNAGSNDKTVFACSGRSSSFRAGNTRVYLLGISAKKLELGDDLVGQTMRALWYLGRRACDARLVAIAVNGFNRLDRQELRSTFSILPAWLSNYFVPMLG